MKKHPLATHISSYGATFFSVMLGVGTLMGCSDSHAGFRSSEFPFSPNARLYSYFMINGIAQGTLLTGEKGKEDLPVMQEEDKKARDSVLSLMKNEKGQNEFQTDLILTHYLSEIRSKQ